MIYAIPEIVRAQLERNARLNVNNCIILVWQRATISTRENFRMQREMDRAAQFPMTMLTRDDE